MASHKIFVINLDSSVARMEACENQLRDFNYERVSAVDGNDLDRNGPVQCYDADLNRQQYHCELTCGEIGCYLSHRKVWQKIVDERLDFALVLEDDFVSDTDISELLHHAVQIRQPWHYIKLAEYPVKRKIAFIEKVGNAKLGIYNKIPAKTCAQIVSFIGAQYLLAKSEKFGRPVDIDIQYWWENGLRVFGLRPYPFAINQNIDSDIEGRGARNKPKKRRLFKWYKQILFYYWNKHQTATLLLTEQTPLRKIANKS